MSRRTHLPLEAGTARYIRTSAGLVDVDVPVLPTSAARFWRGSPAAPAADPARGRVSLHPNRACEAAGHSATEEGRA